MIINIHVHACVMDTKFVYIFYVQQARSCGNKYSLDNKIKASCLFFRNIFLMTFLYGLYPRPVFQ